MYSRDYRGRTVNFEASGGLVNASLVMQDEQTDTYWSIMEGEAVAGELSGEKLVELPVSEKIQWRHWKEKHPDHSRIVGRWTRGKTAGEFSGVESLGGFDTFWYNFSLNNPETLLLE